MALTRRQKEVLDWIAGFISSKGYSPSFEEIAEGIGLASIATVHKHLTALDSKGYLKRSFNQSRALDLAPKYYREMRQHKQVFPPPPETPLLGTIAAGRRPRGPLYLSQRFGRFGVKGLLSDFVDLRRGIAKRAATVQDRGCGPRAAARSLHPHGREGRGCRNT